MMSGPEPASTAAAVFGCSWSPVTLSIATVTPLASPHSVAWRVNSASAGLTKLVHWSSRMEAPLRGLGMVAVGPPLDWEPHEMIISGNARAAATTPDVRRKSRRDQPNSVLLFPCGMAEPPQFFKVRPQENPILTLVWFAGLLLVGAAPMCPFSASEMRAHAGSPSTRTS